MVLFALLLIMCCFAEYLLNKMILTLSVLDKKYTFYHAVCAILRNAWILFGVWSAVPMPLFLLGLFLLLLLIVIPYPSHRLMMNNFTMIIFLFYTSMLMTITGILGLLGFDMSNLIQDRTMRFIILTAVFTLVNAAGALILYYYPESLWRVDYDKSKVMIYTCFLFICSIYHVLDAAILHLYQPSMISYLLLVSGDLLILILMFNFLNYNHIFAKSQDMRREYEESQVLIAQQYFEKISLEKLSGFDSLTNTYNRREICSIMAENIQQGHQMTCVFIDLDGLKRINDHYGHTFGDLMLKRFADTCVHAMAGKGRLARLGGDEFLLVFQDGEISHIDTWIKDLQLKLLEPEDDKEKISFSYGISHGEESVDNYIITADQRMYADKNRKRCDNR